LIAKESRSKMIAGRIFMRWSLTVLLRNGRGSGTNRTKDITMKEKARNE
jgi:hypothetical protein